LQDYQAMSKYSTVGEYIKQVPPERVKAFKKIRKIVKDNLPKGFKECIMYNMPGWVVPLKTYPSGYHCTPDTPLPFINLANQKGYIALYHSGIYADPATHDWFIKEYQNHCKTKLDMGKSCIRFKKMDDIPYELIEQLVQKFTVESWIELYEKNVKR